MPSTFIGLAILIAALAPGFAYLQTYHRYVLRETRSTTAEVVEMGAAGGIATLAAALAVLGLAETVPGLVPLKVLASGGAGLRADPWETVASASLTLVLSVAACAGTGILLGRRSAHRVGTIQPGNAFAAAFAPRRADGREAYLAIELTDGRLVEGYLRYATAAEDPARRELVLQPPIVWSGTGYTQRTKSAAAGAYIPGVMIQVVHISYPERRRTQSTNP